MSSENPVILVDGSSYLFRAYHALPPLTTRDNHPTGAIKGVINMIRSLQKSYPTSKIIVVFDAKGKNFRHDLFPDYKANRPPMPDDLRVQIQPIHDMIKAMGLPLIVIDKVEADDVIGTLAQQATQMNQDTLISTGDKDMAQLVNKHVVLINTMTNQTMDMDGVKEKMGVAPHQIIDLLTLMGDKVDNIPGVEKCGPKTAVKWLTEFESLQGVIDNAEKIKGKVGENLRSSLEQLPLSYQLATIKLDVELPFHLEDIDIKEPDNEKLLSLYQEFEFNSWIKELSSSDNKNNVSDELSETDNSDIETHYETILDINHLNRWIERLKNAPVFAIDTETTGLDYMSAELVGLSFSDKPGHAAYLPLTHDYLGAPKQLDTTSVLSLLKPLLESDQYKKVGQNLKYDLNILVRYDIHLQGIAFDTMLESYTYNSTSNRHDMDSLAQKYLDHQTVHFEDIAGKGKNQLTFNQIELEPAAHYAAEDADITLQLHHALWEKLQLDEGPKRIFEHIELPLLSVLSKIERDGVLIDASLLQDKSQQFESRILELEKTAFELAEEEFNLASPKQLQQILFEKQGLPVLKKTPKKQPSTAEEVLQELALDYPLPKVILEHRSLSKLKSTYTDKLPQMIHPETGRVHTSYHQAVAATGRLSSADPNLQNIPIKSTEGRSIRQAFIAPKHYKILAADYSQIELRIMAHLSQDTGLLNAFSNNQDIHKATAAEVFDVALDKVSEQQRRHAKAVNFGLIYGMSAFGLAKQLHIPRDEAQNYIDTYFARYPGVEDYMSLTRKKAAELGYVETLFGRRLYLPEINASNAMRRKAAERTAINAPMQGSAADIIKLAMIQIDRWLTESNTPCKMIMQVHDELVFEVAEEACNSVKDHIEKYMMSAAQLTVPLVVDIGIGNNWDEAH